MNWDASLRFLHIPYIYYICYDMVWKYVNCFEHKMVALFGTQDAGPIWPFSNPTWGTGFRFPAAECREEAGWLILFRIVFNWNAAKIEHDRTVFDFEQDWVLIDSWRNLRGAGASCVVLFELTIYSERCIQGSFGRLWLHMSGQQCERRGISDTAASASMIDTGMLRYVLRSLLQNFMLCSHFCYEKLCRISRILGQFPPGFANAIDPLELKTWHMPCADMLLVSWDLRSTPEIEE